MNYQNPYYRPQRGGLYKDPGSQAVTGATVAVSTCLTMMGFAYLSVPLYKVLCQKYGWQGTVDRGTDAKLLELIDFRRKRDTTKKQKKIVIRFETRVDPSLPWKFEPVQSYVVAAPGETALAFFSVYNYSKRPITAVSTYGVLPFKTGPYFVKVQCFCFEEQRVRSKEKVDMPVLFYIDPKFEQDLLMEDVTDIVLSYNFFEVEVEEGPLEEDDADDPFYNEDLIQEQMKRGANLKQEVLPENEFQTYQGKDRMLGWGGQYSPKRKDVAEIAAKGNDL
jgi:cytochrome c oxidase assembly protein subunit 11